jgi:hypothetical protein
MYFRTAYPVAAKYDDSTLVNLDLKSREFIHIQKVRKDLDEVYCMKRLLQEMTVFYTLLPCQK